jgi:hypothetical protein
MVAAYTCKMTLPGPILQRGFRLHVWQVEIPEGEVLDVGRTGDKASPHATARYLRMGRHLGFATAETVLHKQMPSRASSRKTGPATRVQIGKVKYLSSTGARRPGCLTNVGEA